MADPSLTPIPPTPGDRRELAAATPLILDEGAAVIEPIADGWQLRAVDPAVTLNGRPIPEPIRLRDRDEIRLGLGDAYEFATGEQRTRRMTSAADMIARPRKRASGALPTPRRNVSFAAIGSIVIALALVAGAAYVGWYGLVRAPNSVVTLTDRQAAELDSLLIIADDHVERGGMLLELGLGDGALDEFADAVTTLDRSDLRNNPIVKPRIQALEASVAAIYRERSQAVPGNYANATAPLTADQMKTASLSADDFRAKFDLMSASFEGKFGHQIVVSGRDHAEHVILYGRGGAVDLSIKGMTREEVNWVIGQSHAFHIRVKDFSQDSVLRRQVARAIKAGLLFEAGTGLHLHIDRFANKRDRWTTLRTPSEDHELDPRHPGYRELVAIVKRPMLAPVEKVLIHVGAVQ